MSIINDPSVQPESDAALAPVRLLAAVERLRDQWAERAYYLEQLAGHDTDQFSQQNAEHAKIIRTCVRELYEVIEAANDQAQARRSEH